MPDSHQYALAIFMRRARRIRALMIAQNRPLNFPVSQLQHHQQEQEQEHHQARPGRERNHQHGSSGRTSALPHTINNDLMRAPPWQDGRMRVSNPPRPWPLNCTRVGVCICGTKRKRNNNEGNIRQPSFGGKSQSMIRNKVRN